MKKLEGLYGIRATIDPGKESKLSSTLSGLKKIYLKDMEF